jgi:hypothetical protein
MLSAIVSQTLAVSYEAEKRPAAAIARFEAQPLLPVGLQDLIAGHRQLWTILLKAGKNGEIALINHWTAIALNVARTSRLLLRRAAALRWRIGNGNG